MSAADAIPDERLEALLRGDPPRSEAEERRAALAAELRRTAPAAPALLHARVAAAAPRPRRLRLPAPRRPLLALAPVALVLALAAATVHGVVSPAPRAAAPRQDGVAAAKTAPAAATAAPRAERAAAAAHDRSRASRIASSGLRFLAWEAAALAAAAVLAGLALALARGRRRRAEARLLHEPAGRRGDLME